MRENNKKSILFLHVAVMLFGFSGVLAQYIILLGTMAEISHREHLWLVFFS